MRNGRFFPHFKQLCTIIPSSEAIITDCILNYGITGKKNALKGYLRALGKIENTGQVIRLDSAIKLQPYF